MKVALIAPQIWVHEILLPLIGTSVPKVGGQYRQLCLRLCALVASVARCRNLPVGSCAGDDKRALRRRRNGLR